MKIKKIILMAILFALILLGIQSCSKAATYGDWSYEVRDNGKVEITKYNGEATNVEIPNTIEGKAVYRLGNLALEYSKIQTIYIPTNIEEIEDGGFSRCSFRKVTFADDCKITSIGGFASMNKLTSINIPKNVTKIRNSAFYGCTALKNIIIPDGVKEIENGAFGKCTGLTTLKIPSNVKEINDSMFYGCTGLKNIVIPNGVTTIKTSFWYCSNLETIIIPASVKEIRTNCFNYCDKNKLTIYCPSISTAIEYAKEQGFKYKRTDNVEDYTISGIQDKNYTGKAITLDLKLTQLNTTLKEGTDYTVSYQNNINEGKATVTITGKGTYKGKVSKTFNIIRYKLGDVNNDKKIDTKDARQVLLAYVGKVKLSTSQQKAADVNKDGKVDTKDARQILLYYVGKISNF